MSFLKVKNRASSTLAANILAADLSLTLATGEGVKFPATNFNITIVDEILFCSSRTGDVLTVVRAQEGTTAVDHTLGDAVELRITAGVIENLERGAGQINVEVLSADKTLVAGVDEMYQWLNPSTASWSITLDTASTKVGDRFVIKNNDVSTSSYSLTIYQSTTILDKIYANGSKVFIFDGTDWQGADNGVKDTNIGIGYSANGLSSGAAVGYSANGLSSGAAVGYSANGSSYGAAVGRYAYGYTYGAAVGYYANGSSSGAAVGRSANGSSSGAAIGYQAYGYTYGAAVGRSAYGYTYGAAVGRSAFGATYGVAVGYSSRGTNYGSALGYYAGNGQTGSYNINIGQLVTSPVLAGNQQLNIGNVLYGTGIYGGAGLSSVPIAGGKIGIGKTTPQAELDVEGTIITKGYTVATLPTGVVGMRAYVTDATTPTYLGALTGGGAVTCPVFFDGTSWVSA